MARWAPALRMARRDLRRHPGRSLLVLLLVMLPIAAATCVATLQHDRRWEGENAAREVLGGADALVTVSGYPRVRVVRSGEGIDLRPAAFTRRDGARVPVRRDPASVDLSTLLPPGSRSIPAPTYAEVRLATGGRVQALLLDAGDPMTPGLGGLRGIDSGRVPTAPDEVAVPPAMADELGLLDGRGRLRPDATLATTTDRLRVVGLTPRQRSEGVTLVAPPDSVLGRDVTPTEFLVDLPALGGPGLHALDRALRAHGVGLLPRDAYLHPRQWGDPYGAAPRVDAGAVALGAFVVLLGLVEVVLVVGAAFAVGARRQVRELGLLAASGGSAADVRRVLLGQGAVVGVVGSALGATTGLALNGTVRALYEWARGTTVWAHDVPWAAVAVICVLGALTGVAAALVPALSVSRLTPVAALDGSFPIRPGESRAHRPAFLLAGSGLVLLVVGGLWTAQEYDPERASAAYRAPSGLPVALCGLATLLLVAGAVWSAPYAVRLVARLGARLPVSGRYAFRDAARHRFRTAAAAIALTVTVAGTLFAGFGTASAAADAAHHRTGLEHSFSTYLEDGATVGGTRTRQTVRTLRAVLGPVRVDIGAQAFADRSAAHYLGARARGYDEPVGVLGAGTLRLLVAEADRDRAVAALRDGDVVTTDRDLVRHGQVRLRVVNSKGAASRTHAATVVRTSGAQLGDFFSTWVSPATAHALGLQPRPVNLLATAGRAITSDDVTRLAVRGIGGWTPDVQDAQITLAGRLVLAGAALVTLVVAGIAVALAAAEGRSDTATLAAVGAGPGRRRRMGAAHGLLLGLVGLLLGLLVGVPAGAAVLQVDGLPGLAVPWELLAGVVLAVPVLSAFAGWVVTPSRLELVRRTG